MHKVLKKHVKMKEDNLVVWVARITVGVLACLGLLASFIAFINACEPMFGKVLEFGTSNINIVFPVSMVVLFVLCAVDRHRDVEEQ